MSSIQKNPGPNSVFYGTAMGMEEIRTGYLIKSPPSNKFKSLRSWKRRFFVLLKRNEKEHTLTYFRNANDRDKPLGSIEISQISVLFCSPQSHRKWRWIQKTFKCSPDSVLFIQAADRQYFLIDENNGDMEGWFKDISKTLSHSSESLLCPEMLKMKMMQLASISKMEKSHNQGSEKPRPSSDPVTKLDLSNIRTPPYCCPQLEEGHEKLHPHSDPASHQDLFHLRTQSCSSEGSSSSERSTPETPSDSTQEPLYDTPKNILKYLSQGSVDGDDDEDEEQNEETDNSFYMTMDAVYEVLNMNQQGSKEIPPASGAVGQDSEDSLLRSVISALEEQKVQMEQSEEDQDTHSDRGSSRAPSPPDETALVSPVDVMLNRVKNRPLTPCRLESQHHISVTDGNVADVREIYLNPNDLKTHLTLVEVDGKPCVSHWPALSATRCLFRKGDQILAVNDLLTESVEEVQTYLNKLLKNQVKLTVQRQAGSETFFSSRWGNE